MESRILKTFIIVCVSLYFVFGFQTNCKAGGGYDPDWFHRSFWDNEEMRVEDYRPYFFIRTIEGEGRKDRLTNIEEWAVYFKTGSHTEDIWQMIFTSELEDLTSIQHHVLLYGKLPQDWSNNRVANFWLERPADESLEYVIYAKKCEYHALKGFSRRDYGWSQGELSRDTTAMRLLIDEGLKLHEQSNSEFMRLRYAFQIVRLAHYAGNFRESIEHYNQLVATNDYDGVIRYFARSQKAGAAIGIVRRGGIYDKASIALDYGTVYRNCAECRMLSVYDLGFFDAEDFFEAAERAQTYDEKLGVWYLSGIRNIPEHIALKEVYKLNPQAPEAENMMIKIAEVYQRDYARLLDSEDQLKRFQTAQTTLQFAEFLQQATDEQRGYRPAVWAHSAAVMQFVTGEYGKAKKYLEKSMAFAEKNGKSEIKTLSNELMTMVEIHLLDPAVEQNEQQLIALIHETGKIQNEYTKMHTQIALYRFFEQQNLEVEAGIVLAWIDLENLYSNGKFRNELTVDKVNTYIEALEATKPHTLRYALFIESRLNKFSLNHFKSILYFQKRDFAQAKQIMEAYLLNAAPADMKINQNSVRQMLYADPFKEYINDCINCDWRKGFEMSLYDFVRQMVELEDKMNHKRTKSNSLAQYHYLYATALYNITYYGNNRYVNWRIFHLNPDGNDREGARPFQIHQHYDHLDYYNRYRTFGDYYTDNSLAMKHFKKAASLSNDREFQAKAYFMASKCEQNQFYNYNKGDKDTKNNYFRTMFTLLNEQYSDTDFTQKLVRQCSYYKHFFERDR